MYDENNIFQKIINKQINANVIFENDNAISFKDLYPDAEIHVLIIPKGKFENVLDFFKNANEIEKNDFFSCFVKTTEILNIKTDFNIVSNTGTGPLASQSIKHFHLHLLAGNKITKKHS